MPSRRQVLAGSAVLLAGTSGCVESEADDTPTPTASERAFPHSTDAPAARTVRHPGGDPAVRSSLVTPLDDWDAEEWVVATPDQRAALDFSTGATGVDAAERFVDDTDLSAATLLVDQYGIEACLTRELERLRWGPSAEGPEGSAAVRLEYTATERDADCPADADDDVEATVVRMPAEVEGVVRFGSQVEY